MKKKLITASEITDEMFCCYMCAVSLESFETLSSHCMQSHDQKTWFQGNQPFDVNDKD